MTTQKSVSPFRSTWDAELVAQALLGVRRFNQFHRELGLSRRTLAERLKDLVAEGVLVRQRYQSCPDRFEYHLTRKGHDLLPVVVAMMEWTERWRPQSAAPSGNVVHALSRSPRDGLG